MALMQERSRSAWVVMTEGKSKLGSREAKCVAVGGGNVEGASSGFASGVASVGWASADTTARQAFGPGNGIGK
jgi:hypothetical protein